MRTRCQTIGRRGSHAIAHSAAVRGDSGRSLGDPTRRSARSDRADCYGGSMGRSRDTHLPQETAFGRRTASVDQVPLSLPVQKAQALFAARAKIMTLRWGGQEERLAGQSLRRALYLIRSVAGTNGVRVAAARAAPSAGTQLDVFKRAFSRVAPPRMKHSGGLRCGERAVDSILGGPHEAQGTPDRCRHAHRQTDRRSARCLSDHHRPLAARGAPRGACLQRDGRVAVRSPATTAIREHSYSWRLPLLASCASTRSRVKRHGGYPCSAAVARTSSAAATRSR